MHNSILLLIRICSKSRGASCCEQVGGIYRRSKGCCWSWNYSFAGNNVEAN